MKYLSISLGIEENKRLAEWLKKRVCRCKITDTPKKVIKIKDRPKEKVLPHEIAERLGCDYVNPEMISDFKRTANYFYLFFKEGVEFREEKKRLIFEDKKLNLKTFFSKKAVVNVREVSLTKKRPSSKTLWERRERKE